MQTVSHTSGLNLTKTKQRGIFTFRHAAMGFLLGVFVFPSYFGIDIGFDLTVLRFFEIILLFFIYKNKVRQKQFINLVVHNKYSKWIGLFLFVVLYTNILRGSISGILYFIFNVAIVYYLMLYLIQYEYGISKFIKILHVLLWIVCLISLVQLVIGYSPFSLLDTLGKSTLVSRNGSTRLTGNCSVANGFGLYCMLLLPVAAYDYKKMQINILNNFALVALVTLCGILTGSRLAVGIAVLELLLLTILSPKGIRGKTFIIECLVIIALTAIVIILQDINVFRSLIATVLSAVDAVLDTNLAASFGATTSSLSNSSKYRELLWQYTFLGGWLSPWLGRGASYSFSMWVEGFYLESVDNYYVGLYIMYAWPGVISFLLFVGSFLLGMLKNIQKKKDRVSLCLIVSLIGYLVSLWYLDQLSTLPYFMALLAMIPTMNYKKSNEKKS